MIMRKTIVISCAILLFGSWAAANYYTSAFLVRNSDAQTQPPPVFTIRQLITATPYRFLGNLSVEYDGRRLANPITVEGIVVALKVKHLLHAPEATYALSEIEIEDDGVVAFVDLGSRTPSTPFGDLRAGERVNVIGTFTTVHRCDLDRADVVCALFNANQSSVPELVAYDGGTIVPAH